MALLSKAEILAADDILTEVIEVPEWGGSVTIKAWTVAQADSYGKLIMANHKDETFISRLRETVVSMSIVDEDGKLMFNDKDMIALGKKSPAALNRVHKAVMALNKLQNEDGEEASKND